MILPDENATERAGQMLAGKARAGDIIALSGELGAGKTAFARGFLAGLGFVGEVPSPSFALVIGYDPPDVRIPVAHVDLYRIETAEAIDELGLDDLGDGILLVEWAERLGAALWPDALKIHISVTGERERGLTVSVPPSWEGRCPLS